MRTKSSPPPLGTGGCGSPTEHPRPCAAGAGRLLHPNKANRIRTVLNLQPPRLLHGHLVLPSTEGDGYHWTGQTGDTPGVHTVTAVADQGHALSGRVEWTVHVKAAGRARSCTQPATEVTPLEPEWVEATCATGPKVNYRAVSGVQYVTTGVVAPERSATVTASAVGNHVLAANAVSSWTHEFDAVPTGSGSLDPPRRTRPTRRSSWCRRNTPRPATRPAPCDGKLKVPGQPAGVPMTRTGSAPGDVTFTFAPAEGYAFPEGTDTEVVVTVPAQLTGQQCLLGEGHEAQAEAQAP